MTLEKLSAKVGFDLKYFFAKSEEIRLCKSVGVWLFLGRVGGPSIDLRTVQTPNLRLGLC